MADLGNKQGLVNSAQANVDRLRVLEQYKRIVAPFNGLVTARTTDVGALIERGRRQRPGAVRRIGYQQAACLRQRAAKLRTGHQDRRQGADFGSRISRKDFAATVEALSQAVDITSETTRVQLAIDNAGHELLPGDFVDLGARLLPMRDRHGIVAELDADLGKIRSAVCSMRMRFSSERTS